MTSKNEESNIELISNELNSDIDIVKFIAIRKKEIDLKIIYYTLINLLELKKQEL